MLNTLPGFDELMFPATKRRDLDYYPTRNLEAIRIALKSCLPVGLNPSTILDPSLGDGPWAFVLREMFPNATIYACDIDPNRTKPDWVDVYLNADYLHFNWRTIVPEGFDIISTNPPYGIQEPNKKKTTPCVEWFIRKAISELKDGGWLSYLLTQGFLGTTGRVAGLFQEIPIYSCKVYDKRLSFFDAVDEETGKVKKNSTDQINYVQLTFQKGYKPQYDQLGLPIYQGGFIQWGSD